MAEMTSTPAGAEETSEVVELGPVDDATPSPNASGSSPDAPHIPPRRNSSDVLILQDLEKRYSLSPRPRRGLKWALVSLFIAGWIAWAVVLLPQVTGYWNRVDVTAVLGVKSLVGCKMFKPDSSVQTDCAALCKTTQVTKGSNVLNALLVNYGSSDQRSVHKIIIDFDMGSHATYSTAGTMKGLQVVVTSSYDSRTPDTIVNDNTRDMALVTIDQVANIEVLPRYYVYDDPSNTQSKSFYDITTSLIAFETGTSNAEVALRFRIRPSVNTITRPTLKFSVEQYLLALAAAAGVLFAVYRFVIFLLVKSFN